jgi:hypothetical protein
MRRTVCFLLVLVLFSCSLFSVEFIVTPTQDTISAELENPELPLELPEVNLTLKAVYSDGEYSFSARRLERITLGGNLTINGPIRLNQLVGYAACGGSEHFGNIYPYSNQSSSNQFDLLGETMTPNWKNVVDKIEKGKFEQTVLHRFLNEGTKSNIGETHYQFYHVNVPEEEKGNNGNGKGNNPQTIGAFPNSSDSSTIQLNDITANRVHLAVVNVCSNDTIKIGSIKANNIDIFNYGCTIIIDNIDAKNKVRIFNFYGNIIIGKSQTLRTIPAKLRVDLSYDGTTFGIQSQENSEVIINNNEQNRIFYKWGSDEFQVLPNTGVQKSYTGDNELVLMQEKREDFTLKLDISEDWYAYPAGEYKSTLYFTLEPLD